jgi:3-methyladenine DNA glycosylase AlkD
MNLEFNDLSKLISSQYNEERFLALVILDLQIQKKIRNIEEIYRFYLDHIIHINNWNLVDCSAHIIVGAYHHHLQNIEYMKTLARSSSMWERRIAMISTLYFIRKHELSPTFEIADILLHDTHDLIHKAVGWMLREAGKKDRSQLVKYLDKHAHEMPRTMLRYSLEKFEESRRKYYLKLKDKTKA